MDGAGSSVWHSTPTERGSFRELAMVPCDYGTWNLDKSASFVNCDFIAGRSPVLPSVLTGGTSFPEVRTLPCAFGTAGAANP